MTPFSLVVEGWRDINHSYALVNQYQLLELKAYPEITLYHDDLPLFDPRWSRERNNAGFSAEQQSRIRSVPSSPGGGADVVYRIGFPFRLQAADAGRLVVFVTSENHKFYPQDFYPGARDATARLVTPSSWSRSGLLEKGFRDVQVVPHGVDGGVFHPVDALEAQRYRSSLGVTGEVMFLNVSAMSFNKGVDLLIVAFCTLRQKYADISLVLKDQSNLYGATAKALVEDLKGQLPRLLTRDALGAIHLLSRNLDLPELRLLYGAADAYVSPYRAEGFNLPPLEAAACATPIIVTAGGSTDDYFHPDFALKTESRKISSDELGIYLEPSLDHLIANMEAIILGRAKLDLEAGRRRIAERFSWKQATRRLLDVMSS